MTCHVFTSECYQQFSRIAIKRGGGTVPIIGILETPNGFLQFSGKIEQIFASIEFVASPNQLLELGLPQLVKIEKRIIVDQNYFNLKNYKQTLTEVLWLFERIMEDHGTPAGHQSNFGCFTHTEGSQLIIHLIRYGM